MKIDKRLKIVIAAVILAACAFGGYTYYQSQQTAKQAKAIETADVVRKDLRSTVSATGTISPVDSVEVSPKITARISQVLVKENDRVTAGQTVAILDGKDYEAKRDQAQYKVTNTKVEYDRAQQLYDLGAGTKQALDTAQFNYDTAVSTLAQAESDVAETVITAPMDGVVVGEPKTVGTMAVQGNSNPTVIMRIATRRPSRFWPKSMKRISARFKSVRMRPSRSTPLRTGPSRPTSRKSPRPIRATPGIRMARVRHRAPLQTPRPASSTITSPSTSMTRTTS